MSSNSTASNNNLFKHEKEYRYGPSVRLCLEVFDFDSYARRVPKHILGFSSDFSLTQQRLQEFLHAMDTDPRRCCGEWERWNSMSTLEKTVHESNLNDLKQQQATLATAPLQGTIAPAPPVQRSPSRPRETAQVSPADSSAKRRAPAAPTQKLSERDSKRKLKTRKAINYSEEADEEALSEDEVQATSEKRSPRWTSEEDRILRNAVVEEDMTFSKAARIYFAGSRSEKACHHRWNYHLKAKEEVERKIVNMNETKAQVETQSKRTAPKWTPEEDEILRKALLQEGMTMSEAAKAYFLGSRTEKACDNRWHKILKPRKAPTCELFESEESDVEDEVFEMPDKSHKRSSWTLEEDRILRNAMDVEKLSIKNAAETYFKGQRSLPSCKHRWYGTLKRTSSSSAPVAKKQKITATETSPRKTESSPRSVAKDTLSFPRSEHVEAKKHAWEPEEDELILERTSQGFFFKDIANALNELNPDFHRTAQDVRERYEDDLDPDNEAILQSWASLETQQLRAKQQKKKAEAAAATRPLAIEESKKNGEGNDKASKGMSSSKPQPNQGFSEAAQWHSDPNDIGDYDV